MSTKYFFTLLFTFFTLQLCAQKFQISGAIIDENGLRKPGVTLTISALNYTIQTDSLGEFKFAELLPARYKISISCLGYRKDQVDINLVANTNLGYITLKNNVRQLQQVNVQEKVGAQRKKTESLNVETVTSGFIQRNLGGSLMKSLERLPGVKTIGIGSGQSKPLIRGLGFNRVVVVENGIKHEGQQWGADHGLEIDQFAVEKVEVVKGAASFVYGSDAIAGALDIKPPAFPAQHTSGGDVHLIAKSNNNLYGTSINLFTRKENWFLDARATMMAYGDYRVPTDTVHVYNFPVRLHKSQIRNSAGREQNFHLNGGWVGGKFRSVFYLSNTYSKSGFFANAHGLEPRQVDTDLHDASTRYILMPNQEVNHLKLINRTGLTIGLHQLDMELGFQHNFRQEFSAYVNHGYMPAIYPENLGIPRDLEREFNKKVYAANLKDKLVLGQHELTGGINLERQENKINGWSFLVPAFQQHTAGAFLYDKLKVNEKLFLHGAVRYDHGQIEIAKYNDWFVSGDDASASQLTRADNLTRVFNSLVWSAGMNYNLQQFAFKANVGKSFRMPIAKELAANGVNYHYFSYEKGNPTLSPEQSYQVDLSFGWNAERWSFQLSPFYNYFPNYIYLNPTSAHDYFYGAGNQVFQYAESEVVRYGSEIQMKYKFSEKWSTEILGEYLYAKQLSGAKKGYTLPFSPPPSLLVNLTYEPQWKGNWSETYFAVDYRLTARQENIVPPEKMTNGNQVINLSVGSKLSIGSSKINISLQAQNLLNVKYLNHTSFYRLIELPEAGRNLILSVKIPFVSRKDD